MTTLNLAKKSLMAMLLAASLAAASCTSIPQDRANSESAASQDPLEPFNRAVFRFNEFVDSLLLKPVTTVYRAVVPEIGREGVSNFLSNLKAPVTIANSILQGDPGNAFTSFWRFVLNTTFGIGGVFDFAGYYGIHERQEDFAQTMGVYGAGSGAYLVLPILGPSSTRDLFGRVVDVFSDPFFYWFTDEENIARAVATGIDTRSENYELIDNVYRDSLDPYATFRSGYLQKRQAEVENRNRKDVVEKAKAQGK